VAKLMQELFGDETLRRQKTPHASVVDRRGALERRLDEAAPSYTVALTKLIARSTDPRVVAPMKASGTPCANFERPSTVTYVRDVLMSCAHQ
jgi:hypothetical protein